MTDAGFFRGTSADQDNRFANKQKKLLEEINFSPILNTKLNMSKIDLETLQPWIVEKVKEILEKDDELLSDSIYEHLKGENEPDGKDLLVLIAGFVGENQNQKTSKFMEELWTKLIDIQENKNGVSPKGSPAGADAEADAQPATAAADAAGATDDSTTAKETTNDEPKDETTPSPRRTSRSVSRSPQVPRKSQTSPDRSRTNSKAKSPSRSHSPSVSQSERASSASSSRSRSPTHSRTRSRTRSRSRSRSYSRSKSSSGSPRRSRSRSPRSPHRPAHRFRRSRSRSSSFHPRSRSPRGRRGFGNGRGSYRGFGYHDRRRGSMGGPIRRRSPPPWRRRPFSPRSPPLHRRRRSPSPRNRSRSPYYRRRSPPRSPPHGHLLGRRSPLGPRSHPMGGGGGPSDMMRGRHVPHHDMHRPIVPLQRSPRPIDHRVGYNDRQMLPRHSPVLGRSHDLQPPHGGLIPSHPGPSVPYAKSPSPSSSRKKHKKEKKHRKHKKSKKHRSASPERRKKHKKHKKSKKHKS